MPKQVGSHNTHPTLHALIIEKVEAGLPLSEIAEFSNCSIWTVQCILQHYQERGHHNENPRSGRPPKLNERSIRHLKFQLDGNRRQTLQDLTSFVNTISPIPVSKHTIWHTLHTQFDMSRHVAAKKPFLSKVHRRARLKWAEEFRGWGMADWSSVIWTDEASVEIGKDSKAVMVWRKPGERYEERCLAPTFKSGRQSLMIWGCIAHGWLGPLVMIPKDQRTGVDYVNLVLAGPFWDFYSELYEDWGLVKVVEDGAPIHQSAFAKNFCTIHHIDTLSHPAQSPDLNPIEHVWKMLKTRVNERMVRPRDLDELWRVLQEEWGKMDLNFINKLVKRMPDCVDAVYNAKGGPTKY
jgi:transposase